METIRASNLLSRAIRPFKRGPLNGQYFERSMGQPSRGIGATSREYRSGI